MSKVLPFRTAYGPHDALKYGIDFTVLDEKTGEFVPSESMVRPEFKHATDVNEIVRRWEKTNILEHTSRHQGQYGDFTSGPQSYHEAVNQVREAESMFAELPSALRERFHNDAGEFLAFVSDDDNIPEMRELGLIPPERSSESDPGAERPANESEASEADQSEDGSPKGDDAPS